MNVASLQKRRRNKTRRHDKDIKGHLFSLLAFVFGYFHLQKTHTFFLMQYI